MEDYNKKYEKWRGYPYISPILKTREEAKILSPLYLDMVEAVSQLLLTLKILLLFGFKAIFTILFLLILKCWTASNTGKIEDRTQFITCEEEKSGEEMVLGLEAQL